MNSATGESPAKLNLTLRVLGRRPDGYHEIESLVAQVDLCDVVRVGLRDDGRTTISCSDPGIPADETNLALRAARLLLRDSGRDAQGLEIALEKRIPAGAGLGGGSSNAATTLRLVNELLGLGYTNERLAGLGATLGADVPLFFHESPCVVSGIGQTIGPAWPEPYGRDARTTPEQYRRDAHATQEQHGRDAGTTSEQREQDARTASEQRGRDAGTAPERAAVATRNWWATIVVPDVRCATADVYAAWRVPDKPPRRPKTVELLWRFRSPGMLMSQLYNDLEPAAFAVRPELERIHFEVSKMAGGPVRMTGSGSALFRLFSDEAEARLLAQQVGNALGLRAQAVRLR